MKTFEFMQSIFAKFKTFKRTINKPILDVIVTQNLISSHITLLH